jgi:low affinity Fe/Cu permease
MNEIFRRFASKTSKIAGSALAFVLAVISIIVWAVTGPMFEYSNTWQLAVNTGTTILTFLMVFLIQNTQNRDSKAMHIKLDELLKNARGARVSLVNIEEISDEQLEDLQQEFQELHNRYAHVLERRLTNSKKS